VDMETEHKSEKIRSLSTIILSVASICSTGRKLMDV
jgi:hypothetical protein